MCGQPYSIDVRRHFVPFENSVDVERETSETEWQEKQWKRS